MAKKPATEETATNETAAGLDRFQELVAEKVTAGLPHDTAAECAKRQLEREDEAAAAAAEKSK